MFYLLEMVLEVRGNVGNALFGHSRFPRSIRVDAQTNKPNKSTKSRTKDRKTEQPAGRVSNTPNPFPTRKPSITRVNAHLLDCWIVGSHFSLYFT